MHIKRVELSHFKSFGGTTQVPFLSGFTVISGPNGSGKSNILDALLFALGLASSKGMRADRLPDLVNQNQMSRRSTSEASVTVTFDISDVPPELLRPEEDDPVEASAAHEPSQNDAEAVQGEASTPLRDDKVVPLPASREWTVTRRLRVTSQGTYTSNYSINGEPCTLGQLHEQLQRFRIYPEGYNVVLQGDVTGIISMNPRERREIIDELAGVASFDRKINQAREKLEVVKEREERFRIVERELQAQLERLAQDRLKAEKYQKLKAQLLTKRQWESVLTWRTQQRRITALQGQIQNGEKESARLAQAIAATAQEIQQSEAQLAELNARVKALGEEEHLALQAQLATQEAERRQLERRRQEVKTAAEATAAALRQGQIGVQEQQRALADLDAAITQLRQADIQALIQARDQVQQNLNARREATSAIADASQAWVQQQTDLRHQIEALRAAIEPDRTEQVRLQERLHQLQSQIEQQRQALESLDAETNDQEQQTLELQSLQTAENKIQALAQQLAEAEKNLKVQRDTQTRLQHEQRDKQRQLDKLEAQAQALQESQGTRATQVLLDSNLQGICGLVAQLGRVDGRYQVALEIAAGARLGYLVVEHDKIAARGIQLLKQQRAGRATFLPLNAIRPPHFNPIPAWKRPDGFIDYAVNLVEFEPRYQSVFSYIFGSTAVFESLETARQNLGQFRIVTLEGELLETSGAMTGGSLLRRQGSLHFGTVEPAESEEAQLLRQRLKEIDDILRRCEAQIETITTTIRETSQALIEARQHHRELQLQSRQQLDQQQQLQQRRAQLQRQLLQYQQELALAQERLDVLNATLPVQESALQAHQQQLTDLEQSQTHSEWQQAQSAVRALEAELSDRQQALQAAERRLQEFCNQQERGQSALVQHQQQITTAQGQQQEQQQQEIALTQQYTTLSEQMEATRAAIAVLDQTLAAERSRRDQLEFQLRERQTHQQQQQWQRQKLQETQQERQQQLSERQQELQVQAADLPDPLPEIPDDLTLEALQKELRSLQRRMEALEPVNMLALEEYNRTQERQADLSQKLTTLEEERTELLLRVENFTTLRQQAFQEAFDVVNTNFQAIFADLSDGDGYLQLDDPRDPFNGGLNLVAHPKGKPVRRLASMSGGEKSLTALSFIFALQRYRPSPFYGFDEVDMFLDGANVERLSRMIKRQAEQAQFIVVSLRRPMIEAAQRTIGVTQARGAYTQVLGIDLQPKSATVGG